MSKPSEKIHARANEIRAERGLRECSEEKFPLDIALLEYLDELAAAAPLPAVRQNVASHEMWAQQPRELETARNGRDQARAKLGQARAERDTLTRERDGALAKIATFESQLDAAVKALLAMAAPAPIPAPAPVFGVGDRVHAIKFGSGIVDEADEGSGRYYVSSENPAGWGGWFCARELTKVDP
jgi:hypothetical protein